MRHHLTENPLPILAVLAALLTMVWYLDRRVEGSALSVEVISVPADPASAHPLSGGRLEELAPLEQAPGRLSSRFSGSDSAMRQVLDLLEQQKHEEAVAGARALADARSEDLTATELLGVALLRSGEPAAALPLLRQVTGKDPARLSAWFDLGVTLRRLDRAQEAEQAYLQLLEQRPAHSEARNNLGTLYLHQGRHREALDQLRRAAEDAAGNEAARVLMNLGIAATRTGRTDEAALAYEKAILRKPDYVEARVNLAVLQPDTPEGRRRARELYEQCLALRPDYAPVHVNLGVLLSRQEEPEQARLHYARALELSPDYLEAHHNLALLLQEHGDHSDAEREFHWMAENEPNDPRASFGLARLASMENRTREAIEFYREAIEKARGSYPEARVNLGIALKSTGKVKDAEEEYRAALENDSSFASAWYNLALLLMEREDWKEALEAARRATDLRPEDPEGQFVLARALDATGDRQGALAAYDVSLHERPAYLKALVNRGILLARMRRHEEAIATYREALSHSPNYAPALYNLGVALHRLERDEEAIEAYERLLEVASEEIKAYQNLGVLYVRRGDIRRAADTFREGLRYRPDDPDLRFNLALQLRKLGQSDEALEELRRVVSVASDFGKGWTYLAREAAAQGLRQEALEAYDRARALSPDDGALARDVQAFKDKEAQ